MSEKEKTIELNDHESSNEEKFEKLMENFKEVLGLDIDKPNVAALNYCFRGNMYYVQGKYEQAIEEFTKAINLNPNQISKIYFSRGLAYGAKGDYDNSITDYSTSLQVNPNEAKVYRERGRVYGIKGDYDLALADINAALQIDPDDQDSKKYLEMIREAKSRKLEGENNKC